MSAIGENAPATDRKGLLAQQLEAMEANPTPVETVTEAASVEALSGTKQERARDDAGKFLAKDKSEPELPLTVSSPAQAAPAPAAEPPLWERPPASWNKRQDLLDPWKGADAKLREMIWTREEQMNAGVVPLKEKARLADEINKVAEPYMNTIRGMGIDLPKAVQGLMYADNILRTAPRDQAKQYLLELAKTYGIQLGEGVADPNAAPVDPNFHALYNEITTLKGEWKSEQQRREEAAAAASMAEINKFALKADFFDEALPTMQVLAVTFPQDSIEDLYNKALRLDENLFEKANQRKQAQTASAQSAAADKAAKTAKAAAVSVKTSTPGASTKTNAQDRRALLEEQFSSSEARL